MLNRLVVCVFVFLSGYTAFAQPGDSLTIKKIFDEVLRNGKAYENLHSFDPSRRFFSWVYRILLNESLNILKSRKRFDALDDTITVESKNPEERYDDRETGRRVQSALMDLKKDHRVVIVLKHYQEMSYREMSEVVGVPEKTIKSRLFSARRQLKDILLRKGIVK